MPVGNMIIRSQKSEIWGKPQTELGPGQYNTDLPDFKPKSGLAPFSSTEERRTGEVTSLTPGPGTYHYDHSSIKVSKRPSPQFISRAERMGGERQRLREMDTPGPGAYAPDVVQESPKAAKARRFHNAEGINWVKIATAPSIPSQGQSHGYEEGPGGKLIQQTGPQLSISSTPGPGSYNPSLEAVKSHGRILQSFGRSHSAPKPAELTPGPGSYDVRFVHDSTPMRGGVGSDRMNSIFASTTGRAKLTHDTYGPGPGGYKLPSGFKSLQQHLAANPDTYSAFGSSAKNPRAVTYDNKVPGPGAYTARETTPTRKEIGPSPQFVSTSRRFEGLESATPGPGTYDDKRAVFTSKIESKTRGRFGVFGATSSRFPNERIDELPPVGAYDTTKEIPNPADMRRRDLRSSSFKAPGRPRNEKADERPVAYDVQTEWKKPQTTSTAFISTVPRFGVQRTSNIPGPGAYDGDLNGQRGKPTRAPGFGQGTRFSSADYKNTPGPGTYDAPNPLVHKSFNITIGDKW